MLSDVKRFFLASPFFQLLMGSVGAQLVAVLWSPALTRLYGPEAFASLALFGATVGIIGNIGAWRFDQSIVTRATDEQAWLSVVLSLLALLLSSLAIVVAIAFFFKSTPQAAILGELAFGCLLTGFTQVAAQVAVRNGSFVGLSRARIGQALGVVMASALLCYCNNGLIWSQLFGYVAAIALTSSGVRRLWCQFGIPNLGQSAEPARRLLRFPVHGLVPSLADNLATALPVYYVVGAFSSAAAGQFGMIRQMIGIGVGLVAAALSQVVMKYAADAIRKKASMRRHVTKYFYVLASAYIPLLGILFLVGENLVPAIFGMKWQVAGAYAPWVATIFLGPFLASPLSVLMIALERLALNGLWQIAHFFGVALIAYGMEWESLGQFIKWLALSEVAWYVIYLSMIHRAVMDFERNLGN